MFEKCKIEPMPFTKQKFESRCLVRGHFRRHFPNSKFGKGSMPDSVPQPFYFQIENEVRDRHRVLEIAHRTGRRCQKRCRMNSKVAGFSGTRASRGI